MWKPYLKVVADRAQQAVHVLDRFHIMSHFSKAIDEVRAAEARKLAAAGKAPVLKHSRWLLLKRPEHLTDAQEDRLADLVRRNLRTVRAYLLKEHFQLLWGYVSPYWAGQFLDRWCTRTMRSRLDPMKEVARMLRAHRDLILNWFRAKGQFSSGVVEGFNGKARVITKRAYGLGAALLRRRPRRLLGAARQELLDPSKAWWGGRRRRLGDRRCYPISVSLGVVPLVLARFVEVPVRIEVVAGS